MTHEDIIQSRLKIAAPLPDYKDEQGDMSNHDWMAYQLRCLEQIVGAEETTNWLNSPNKYLLGYSPAKLGLEEEGDKIVGNFIMSMITGKLADKWDRYLGKCIARMVASLPRKLAGQKKVQEAFADGLTDTENPEEGFEFIVSVVCTMCTSIGDETWQRIMEVSKIAPGVQATNIMQASTILMEALNMMRTTAKSDQSLVLGRVHLLI